MRTLLLGVAALALSGVAAAAEDSSHTMDIYGFVMLDNGYEVNQNDPDWFDVVRPTKLPSFANEFGTDGKWFASVRQSRFGVKTSTPTRLGDLTTQFEFELFGVGPDAGQTTIRLRHAYGELGQFGAGQTWSPFMDIDVFPNTIEYWGPSGMVFFRNVQLRWMPIKGDYNRLTFALERPGASVDEGEYADRIELESVAPRFPYPDLSGEFRFGNEDWGYLELAGIVRYIEWKDQLPDQFDLSGDEVGWGVNLSSNLKLGNSTLRLQVVYGEGIENYMNDAPADIGIRNNFRDPRRPILGEALPVLGGVAFIDINWNDSMSSSIGYSMVDIDNSDGQSANAFNHGDYAIANILFTPVRNFLFGPELQYARRKNFRDGFTADDVRLQVSFKYSFSKTIGGR